MGLVVAQITDKKLGKAWSNTSGDLQAEYKEAHDDWFTGSFDDYKVYKGDTTSSGQSGNSGGGKKGKFDFDSAMNRFNQIADMFSPKAQAPIVSIDVEDEKKSNTPVIIGGVVAIAAIGALIYYTSKNK